MVQHLRGGGAGRSKIGFNADETSRARGDDVARPFSVLLCLCGEALFPAARTIAANLKARDQNMKLAIAFYLSFDAIK